MSRAHIDEFIRASAGEGDVEYVLSLDFYANRGTGKSGSYHKDSNVYTTFIVLSYFNEAPVWGPEWMLDLGEPHFNRDTATHDDFLTRWYEKELPTSVRQEPFATLAAPTRKIHRDLALRQKSSAWIDAETATFEKPRTFVRVEVQARPRANDTTSS